MKLLFAPLLFAASLPAVAEVKPIEVESYLVRQAPIEQVYLVLMLEKRSRSNHLIFPMQDINQCEEEGKRWLTTAIDKINSNDKTYYCVNGSR